MKELLFLALVLIPDPIARHRVHDFAGILSYETERRLENLSREVERTTTAEIAVVTVASLEGLNVDSYATRLFNAWGIGKEDVNNGVLLLVAPGERRARIEVGYGLEPLLTNPRCRVIMDGVTIPYFRRGDFEGGVVATTEEIARVLGENPGKARGIPESTPLTLRVSLAWERMAGMVTPGYLWLGILSVAIAALGGIAWTFNSLVRARNLVAEAWSGIEVQLTLRHALVPNLVETVRGYAKHEKALLEEVTRLRAASEAAVALQDRQGAENGLARGLSRIFLLVEAYPDLKADRGFLDLQGELARIEDRIQLSRRYYNGTVRDLNIRVESFPTNLVAGLLGFSRAEFFEIEAAASVAPRVNL